MTADWTETDLRDVLALESLDVGTPQRLVAQLDEPAPPTQHGSVVLGVIAAAVVVVLVLAGAGKLAPWTREATSSQPPATSTPATSDLSTAHLSLRPVPHFRVTEAVADGDREVLKISYAPTGEDSYEGGEVTLYGSGAFRARTFLTHAVPVPAAGLPAYFGSYPYTGVWGPVTTVAWRLRDGRWVSVQNLRRPDELSSRSTALALELRVARAVVVR